jgi:hypothetical protein
MTARSDHPWPRMPHMPHVSRLMYYTRACGGAIGGPAASAAETGPAAINGKATHDDCTDLLTLALQRHTSLRNLAATIAKKEPPEPAFIALLADVHTAIAVVDAVLTEPVSPPVIPPDVPVEIEEVDP